MTAFSPLAVTALHAEDKGHSEKPHLDSHTHGHATLQIAVDGSTASLAFTAPGVDIVGFEHAPQSDSQQEAVERANARLGDADSLFGLPDAAGCTLTDSEAALHLEGEHSAFEANYSFNCTQVSALTLVTTTLFDHFPSLEEIEVEYATPAGQGAEEMEADNPTVTLPEAR